MKTNVTDWKTTITGLILLLLGVAYFAAPYFSSKELWEVNSYALSSLLVIGLGLIVAPDKIISIAFDWLSSLRVKIFGNGVTEKKEG